MYPKILFLLFFVFYSGIAPYAQQNKNGFQTDRNCFSLSFEHIGNLIVIPFYINEGQRLNMILDTGSRYTLLTDLQYVEELQIKKGEIIQIGGLGNGYEYTAYKSTENSFQLGKAFSDNGLLILLVDSPLNLTAKLGMPVHGIIGTDAFRDFVVEINYLSEKIRFYKHDYFYQKKEKKLNKYTAVPLTFHQQKPYISANVQLTDEATKVQTKLLLDTGGWDAVWLFEHSKQALEIPSPWIEDQLGFGLNGPIMGKRTKIKSISLKNFTFELPTTSFPDSASIAYVRKFRKRNGSLGGEIMRRFKVIMDYKNQTMYLKPNRKYKQDFHFNMSGMLLVKPFLGIPLFEVSRVITGSPADEAGIKAGDLIEKINGKSVSQMTLKQVHNLFHYSRVGKKITVTIQRDGNLYERSFKLRELF